MFGSIDQAMENSLPETHKNSPPSSLARGFFFSFLSLIPGLLLPAPYCLQTQVIRLMESSLGFRVYAEQ
jgi:hypothetical protein